MEQTSVLTPPVHTNYHSIVRELNKLLDQDFLMKTALGLSLKVAVEKANA